MILLSTLATSNEALLDEHNKKLNLLEKRVRVIAAPYSLTVTFAGVNFDRKIVITANNPSVAKTFFNNAVQQIAGLGGIIQQQGPFSSVISVSKKQVRKSLANEGSANDSDFGTTAVKKHQSNVTDNDLYDTFILFLSAAGISENVHYSKKVLRMPDDEDDVCASIWATSNENKKIIIAILEKYQLSGRLKPNSEDEPAVVNVVLRSLTGDDFKNPLSEGPATTSTEKSPSTEKTHAGNDSSNHSDSNQNQNQNQNLAEMKNPKNLESLRDIGKEVLAFFNFKMGAQAHVSNALPDQKKQLILYSFTKIEYALKFSTKIAEILGDQKVKYKPGSKTVRTFIEKQDDGETPPPTQRKPVPGPKKAKALRPKPEKDSKVTPASRIKSIMDEASEQIAGIVENIPADESQNRYSGEEIWDILFTNFPHGENVTFLTGDVSKPMIMLNKKKLMKLFPEKE